MLRYLVPLIVFALLVGLFIFGLSGNRDASELPSPLVGKEAPAFQLAQLHAPDQTFSSTGMAGKVWLLNIWASWCVSCRQEHPLFMEISRNKEAAIYGLNYKDERQDAERWLQQFGDPYVLSASDIEGRVGLKYGVYGVPETFVIDKFGVIAHKVIGPMSRTKWQQCVSPLIKHLDQAAAAQTPLPKDLEEACAKRL